MRKSLSEKTKVKPKRILAAMLALLQMFLFLPVAPIHVIAAGNVAYTRIHPEVSIYNAQTGIDEKLYEREISGDSQFNAATKSSLFGLSFENNLAGTQSSFKIDDKEIGRIRKKDNNLQTSASASFHSYKHQHTWKSGFLNLKKNTANVTTAAMMSYAYRVGTYTSSPYLAVNSRDMAKDYERLSTGYSPIFSYEGSGNVIFDARLQGTMYDGGNRSCACPGDASIKKPVITFMDNNAPSIVSVTGIDNKILKAGETVELAVKFDEPIRFADDSAAHDDLFVNLAISGLSSDRYPRAMLKKLDIDTLYFSYTVPSDATDLEQTVTSVDFSPLMQECGLAVVFEDKSFTLSTDGLNVSSDIGYTRATSYITDIAGNGMRESDRMYHITETYIDTKAPALTKISAAVNANNAAIKEMLGSGDTDNSDIYLGAGDSIEFGLTFSEVLDLGEGEYTGLTAETNLTDSSGSAVTLTSETVSTVPTDNNAYGLGPSKGNVTYIDLGTLTLEDGMICTDADGIIRIKSIRFSGTVSDLAENRLAVSDDAVNGANTTTVRLDVEPPVLITSLSQTDGVYAVVPYADGSGFYFPFEIKDELSGTNGLEGTFKWETEENAPVAGEFYYAITSSAETPDDTQWQTSSINRTTAFQQVEGTQFLHIKEKDNVTYELLNTTLSFHALDYAGNESSNAAFEIDTVWDNTYPLAKLGEVTKELTETGGKLTVNVNLTETTALKDARYLWTDTADEPSLEEIDQVPAGDVEGQTSTTVTITQDVLSDEDFNKYLWIKVSDNNGNEMLYNLGRQRYNLGTIDYNVSTSTDYFSDLYIYFATNDPDGFLFALHPVPGTDNEYYACTQGGTTHNIDNWYKVRSDDRRTFEVLEKTDIDNHYLSDYLFNNSTHGNYYEPFGYRNGDYTFYIISGAAGAFAVDENGYVTAAGNTSYNVSEESYTIRAITPFYDGQDFYDGRSITSQSEIPEMPNYYYYYNRNEILSTLAGLTFDIDLGVDLMGWNYDGIDFDRSSLFVRRINSTDAYEFKLKPQQKQSIILPENEYPTGMYQISLWIYAKNYGQNGCFFIETYPNDIYVDARTAPDVEDFGIDYLELACSPYNYGNSEPSHKYKTGITGQTVYPHGDIIYMPTSNSTQMGAYSGEDDEHTTHTRGVIYRELDESHYVRYNTNLLAWNVTAGQTEELAAVDYTGNGFDMQISYEENIKALISLLDPNDPANNGLAPLYLIQNTVNVIAVRAVLGNGEKSEIKYYSIYPSWMEMPENISTQTNEDGSFVRDDSELIYTPDEGQSMEGIRLYAASDIGEKKELLPQADGTYRCDADSGDSWNYFHAVNQYGSIYYFGEYLNTWRDNEAPVITYESYDQSDGNYSIKFRINDLSLEEYKYNEPIKLKLTFDEAYSARLGYEAGQQASFEVTIDEFNDYMNGITPDDDKEFLWEAEDVSSTGIYRVEAVRANDTFESYMEVTVYGALKYDPERPEGEKASFNLTAEATDTFGYTGSASFDNISATNAKPHVLEDGSIEYQQIDESFDYGLNVPFNTPVQPESSWILPQPEGYQTAWLDGFPITKDGTAEISFYDIFGTLYTQEIELVDVFGDYGVDLTISPKTYTQETITISARMADENTDKLLKFWEVEGDWMVEIKGENNETLPPAKERTVVRQKNGLVILSVYDEGQSGDNGDELTIHIDNMANEAPVAQPLFYFDQYGEEYTEEELSEKFPDGLKTTGYVEVWYNTSRYVSPIDGTGEKVKFTYQDTDTSHLFKYVDDFGNEGSLEFDLADYGITFLAPPEPYKDESAPTLVVDVYAKLFDNHMAAGAFSKDTAPDDVKQEFENIGYVQGYSMKIGVTDDSSYKIVVLAGPPTSLTYGGAQSDTIPGVEISGNAITVSSDIASDFTVAVVDNASQESAATGDNFSYVTIKAEDLRAWFDTTKPTAEQQAVQNGLYEQIVYVKFTDKANDGTVIDDGTNMENSTVTILNGALERETVGEYAGWYKRVFKENSSEEIIFRDHVGNMGDRTTLEASGLDTEAPTLTTTWTPPYVSASGEIDTGRHTEKTVNTSIYAHITANKVLDVANVRLTHYTYDGGDWMALESGDISQIPGCGASYTVNTEGITVRFDQGGIGLRFNVPSPNGRSTAADVYLPAETIDKTVPTVTAETTELKRDGFDIPYAVKVKMTPNESVYCLNYGTAEKLYDSATPLEFTLTQNGTSEYIFADEAGNRTAVPVTVDNIDTMAPELTFSPDPADLPGISIEQKITATVDEDCTLTFDGQTYRLTASSSQELSFSKNGVYTVSATDAAGNESIVNIPVGNVDKTPPDISFENGTIRIRQDSGESELIGALNAGVTAWEPETQKIIEDWTFDASTVDITVVGIYEVIYTVQDAAGNVKTAVRHVSVYDKDSPGIYLDGALIELEGTTVIQAGEHEIKVDHIKEIATGVLEPYTVKISKGILTIGQIKSKRADVVIGSDGKFTITPGFYTVSVITQSRGTFRAIFFVEQ